MIASATYGLVSQALQYFYLFVDSVNVIENILIQIPFELMKHLWPDTFLENVELSLFYYCLSIHITVLYSSFLSFIRVSEKMF